MQTNNKLIRDKQVAGKLGIGRTTVWRMVKEGRLPKPMKLGTKTSVWLEADIEAFIMKEYSKANEAA
jgi:prophage regulatory protein